MYLFRLSFNYKGTNEKVLQIKKKYFNISLLADRAPSEVPLVCRDTYPGSLTTDGEGMYRILFLKRKCINNNK